VAPPHDLVSIVGGALERIFQTLRDQIDHHLPPSTAVVWEEEHAPNSKKEKTRTKRYTRVAPVLEPWRARRSLQQTTMCEREHTEGNLRSLLMTFTIALAFLS
jgi:hypothetical protein